MGIVGDVRHLGLDEGDVPMFYTPHAQQPSYHTMTLVVRTNTATTGLAAAVRDEVRQMDTGVPLYQIRTLDQVLARAVAEPRLLAYTAVGSDTSIAVTRAARNPAGTS